ncbi:hypothetical protein BFP72_18790 [Reichenbachiella sp. 5M10]|uniref:hypothetical protein n=1 Tax=Reichenbachiella sp. 5M10 TaxID=1889772 RepID=UPI000C153CA1|nr:hypothetical protein [Reichenbachiella sp. 5M10]PIB37311.1 hypothetical protein BFP72_18790 [Reichenbachiella sp. 5M10]
MRKNIYLLVSMMIWGHLAFAQNYMDDEEKKEIKSLIHKDNDITGFGSADFKIGSVKEKQSLLVGVHGGMLINKNVMLGLGMYGWAIRPDFVGETNGGTSTKLEMNGGYAGLLLGCKLFPKEIIHISLPVLVGAGNIQALDPYHFASYYDDRSLTVESSSFFVVDSAAEIEMNISHHFRLAVGAGYRFAHGLDMDNLTDGDLSDFYGMLSIQLGKF